MQICKYANKILSQPLGAESGRKDKGRDDCKHSGVGAVEVRGRAWSALLEGW